MIKNESNAPLHFGNVYNINIDQGQIKQQNVKSTQNIQSDAARNNVLFVARDDRPPKGSSQKKGNSEFGTFSFRTLFPTKK